MPASQHGRDLEIRVERHDEHIVLRVAGELDFHDVPAFYAHLDQAWISPGGGPRVIVDLAGLTFCDSAGLGALIYAYNQVTAANGRFVLVAVPDNLRRRMRMSGLDRHLECRDTIDQAVQDADVV
ncbi:STAS domain-containing protein [Sphaerisporangium fuscum]|uniref:STAS domain-containing protein n=1 Tax=Sphaerisporangium fuscum TaxID=2835868 RepID=UPI002029A99A|nr:STAS domain-containing protein [Sphaerisporangium fuscum]